MLYKECVREALKKYCITKEELFSPTHRKNVARCRFVLYKTFLMSGKSTSWVGNYFDRDHTSVINGANKLTRDEIDFVRYLYNKYESAECKEDCFKQEEILEKFKNLFNDGYSLEDIGRMMKLEQGSIIRNFIDMKIRYNKKLIPDYKNNGVKIIYN